MKNIISQFSIRSVILLSLSLLLGAMLAAAYFTEQNILSSIKEREDNFLRKIANVSVKQVYENIRSEAVTFGTHFLQRKEFKQTYQQALKSKSIASLQSELTEPFISGYINATDITLEALRVYDTDWNFIAEGRTVGVMNVDNYRIEKTPNALMNIAAKRKGTEQLKVISGSWVSNNDSYFSVIFPIGGLRLQGYLEVVINVSLNLPTIEENIGFKLEIFNLIRNETVYKSPDLNIEQSDSSESSHKVQFDITSIDKKPMYSVIIDVPSKEFMDSIKSSQSNIMIMQTLLIFLITSLIFILLENLLIRPIRRLRRDIHQQTHTLTGEAVRTRGFREFYDLATDFNHLMHVAKKQNESLEELTLIDDLTKLPNRRALDNFIKTEIKRRMRTKEPLSLIMIDIDYFKMYNDTYGHPQGDRCLEEVAKALKKALPRATDFVSRYGGEEFTVVLPDTELEPALKVAERLHRAVIDCKIPHKSSRVSDNITVSLGVHCSLKNESLNEIIKHADLNLYKAKQNGRNCFL